MNSKKIKVNTCHQNSNSSDIGTDEGEMAVNQTEMFDNLLDQDSSIIQNILPALVWTENILTSHLTDDDPNNFEILINSSPYFRELLKEKRVLFLSKKVFKIFFDWNSKLFCFGPFRQKRAQVAQVLSLRPVCSFWCSSLDQLFQENFMNLGSVLRNRNNFEENSTLNSFFAHFWQSHYPVVPGGRSPLLGGYLRVEFDSNDDEILARGYLVLFQAYGPCITNLVIESRISAGMETAERTYLRIREFLILAPNLTSLEIVLHSLEPAFPSAELIENHPLPKFVNLKKLNVKVPPVIFASLISQNSDISSLKVSGVEYDLKVRLENLEELESSSVCNAGHRDDWLDPQIMGRWPLKRLHLTDTHLVSWTPTFQMISDCWATTLESLHLVIPEHAPRVETISVLLNNCLNLRLELPKVKVLECWMGSTIFSLDFLLGMTSLESVRITPFSVNRNESEEYVRVEREALLEAEERQIVQWLGYENRLEESNIWSLFPKLKMFHCKQGSSSYRPKTR